MVHHKNPVEESFIIWISLNPESFHNLDINRFYVFVHSVIRYKAKSWLHYKKFKTEIMKHKPNFKEENVEYYFSLMNHLIAFSKSTYCPLYEADDYSKVTVKKVFNRKIIIED